MPDAARVRLRLVPAGVEVQYSDRGRPYNPLDAPPPDLEAPLEEREIGGLGVHLLRRTMSDLRYERSGDCNRLTMIRRLEPK